MTGTAGNQARDEVLLMSSARIPCSVLLWQERACERFRPRTQLDPEPVSPPATTQESCEPPADGEPEDKVTTLALEEEPPSESDQRCEPATSVAEGILVEIETEDWLMDLSTEVRSSTPPAAAGSSFPSGTPQSSIKPASPQSSGTLAQPQMLINVTSLWPPVPALRLRPGIHQLHLR
ncbi:unnamed protein product [Leuciscus chuanchicus]